MKIFSFLLLIFAEKLIIDFVYKKVVGPSIDRYDVFCVNIQKKKSL